MSVTLSLTNQRFKVEAEEKRQISGQKRALGVSGLPAADGTDQIDADDDEDRERRQTDDAERDAERQKRRRRGWRQPLFRNAVKGQVTE